MHLEKQTQSYPAMIHMLSNPQCTHRKPPYAQVLQKMFDKCVYFHKNTLYVKYKVFLILLYNRSLKWKFKKYFFSFTGKYERMCM